MIPNEHKLWYLGIATSLSGSLLIACAIQSVNSSGLSKVLWTIFYMLAGIFFFGISQKAGKIMGVSRYYIKGLQIAMITVITSGLVGILLTNSSVYESLAILSEIISNNILVSLRGYMQVEAFTLIIEIITGIIGVIGGIPLIIEWCIYKFYKPNIAIFFPPINNLQTIYPGGIVTSDRIIFGKYGPHIINKSGKTLKLRVEFMPSKIEKRNALQLRLGHLARV